MYVHLKESELNRKLFINKSYKQGTIKLLFSRETPFHEIKDESVIAFLLKSFPNFLEKSKDIPSFLNKKEKKESPAPIVKPEPKKEVAKEAKAESVIPSKEGKDEVIESVVSASLIKSSENSDPTPSQILSSLLNKKTESE